MFSYHKIKEILEKDYEKDLDFEEAKEHLNEDRPTNTFEVARGMKHHPMFDKLVELQSMPDGMAMIMRTKDGQAYEILIRPLQYAKYFTPPKPKKK